MWKFAPAVIPFSPANRSLSTRQDGLNGSGKNTVKPMRRALDSSVLVDTLPSLLISHEWVSRPLFKTGRNLPALNPEESDFQH
jgi:hypothetical protein